MESGIGTSNGIGIGNAVILEDKEIKVITKKITETEEEYQRFLTAKETFVDRTNQLIADLTEKLGAKSAAIVKNQLYLLNDAEFIASVGNAIRNDRLCAEAAVDETCRMFINVFRSMEDENMHQRVIDIEDIRTRMLRILMGLADLDLGHLPENTIIVANELAPSVTAVMDTKHIVGIVAEKGGETSHASILARALEIPAVLSVKDARSLIHNGDCVIVDGAYGEVFINPIPKTLEIYHRKQAEYAEQMNELKKFKEKETVTKDGHKVELAANIGSAEDVSKMLMQGGEGVGLFRTEFLFMNGFSMPTEEEQFEEYKKAAVMCKGKPLIIRTLDIGGDKDIPYMGLSRENNPFLGYRAIRYCLDRVDVFLVQLRAILRASAYGKIKIMIPLVTSLDEVVDVKRHIHNLSVEFDAQGIKYDQNIEIGVMIETPAASMIADILAKEVDFFSIGTNDLIQYTMAVDRGNENVSYLYSPFHPAVLRSIQHIIACAHAEHIPVGMCGEAAGNPNMIPLLLTFGLDEFSVTASNILTTRKNIASWSMEDAAKVTEQVMRLWTTKEIINYLNERG